MITFSITGCSENWIDIFASILPEKSGYAEISSRHYGMNGVLRRSFRTVRSTEFRSTEYGLGLSVVHDVKDHYLHGLDITPLTEFQTIVQTYYGREISGGKINTAHNGDFMRSISNALSDEFYGPRQPRVYDENARGLFDEHGVELSSEEKYKLLMHMHKICFDIMLPEIKKLYKHEPGLLALQKSTLEQPELVDFLMPGTFWLDEEARILRSADNFGNQFNIRVHPHLGAKKASQSIAQNISKYVEFNRITDALGPVFSTKDYCV